MGKVVTELVLLLVSCDNALKLFVRLLKNFIFFFKFRVFEVELGDEFVDVFDKLDTFSMLAKLLTLDVLEDLHAVAVPQVVVERVGGKATRSKALHAHVLFV